MKIFFSWLLFGVSLTLTGFFWARTAPEQKQIAIPLEPLTVEEKILFGIPFSIRQLDEKSWQALPGIGPQLAHRIFQFVKTKRGEITLEDLKQVYGIGDKTIAKIKPYFNAKSDF